jgi:predicted AAA+ superfamily ATPase
VLVQVSVDLNRNEEGLNDVFLDMEEYIKNLPPSASKPTIILDEISALLGWTKDRSAALRQLLNFLILWSKQKNALNVILASSDSFIFYWLAESESHSRLPSLPA